MGEKTIKRIQLKDIAEKAGVSISLVSFVLNGKAKHYRVADKKAELIKRIAGEMNYVPNMVAKGLRSGKTNTIGLIVADVAAPFFAKLARKIEDYAYNKGYAVIIGSTDERADKSAKVIETMRSRGVDGFLLAASENTESQVVNLINHAVPTVMIDRFFSGIDIVSVKLDNFKASYDGTIHLVKQGFENIAIVAYDTTLEHVVERIKGYEQALYENNLTPNIKRIFHSEVENSSREMLAELFDAETKPDAIIFMAGQLCIKGISYIKRKGLTIPRDVAIVSFDNVDLFELFYSPITYIEQPIDKFAEVAVDLLIAQIENCVLPTKNDTVMLDAKLIVNSSSLKQ